MAVHDRANAAAKHPRVVVMDTWHACRWWVASNVRSLSIVVDFNRIFYIPL